MGDKLIPLGLQRKRDEICGVIAHYERLIREAQHDLAHVNASLRLFEATGEAADLPPYVDLNRVLTDLCAVVNAPRILTPRAFLCIAEKVRAGNVMMMADLGTADAAKETLREIGTGFAVTIGFLMVDAAHFVTVVKRVP
jgi:hypothetical protein